MSTLYQVGKQGISDIEALISYGMHKVADVRIGEGDRFQVTITDPAFPAMLKTIYAFVIGGVIQRIGSSKHPFRRRMRAYELDITGRWHNPEGRSCCPKAEADGWHAVLQAAGSGQVYARQGSTVTTPVGTFPVYQDEESILLGRHAPPLNRCKHR